MTRWMKLAPLALLMMASACTVYEGNGNIVEEKRELSRDVSDLRVDGVRVEIEVDPHHTGRPEVTVRADENLLSRVRTDVTGRALTISEDGWLEPTAPIRARVRVRSLDEVRADGGEVYTEVSGLRRLTVEASGNANIYLAGDVKTLELRGSGSGRVDAKDLSAWVARIDLRDGSSAEVCVEDTLDTAQRDNSELHTWCTPFSITEDLSDSAAVYHHR